MGVPTRASSGDYGANANTSQTDNTSAMGGAKSGTALVDGTTDELFDSTPANAAGGADIVHYNIFYRDNHEGAGGHMLSGLAAIYNGLLPNSSSGIITFTLTNPADAGLQVMVVAQVSGVFPGTPEKVVMVNPTANSTTAPDVSKLWRLECLDAATGLVPTCPAGDIIVSIGGQTLGAIRAAVVDNAGNTISPTQATQEFNLAIATAKNTALSSANRLTAPGSIGSFSVPILIDGTYSSALTVVTLNDTDYMGFCWKKRLVAGISPPLGATVQVMMNYQFSPTA